MGWRYQRGEQDTESPGRLVSAIVRRVPPRRAQSRRFFARVGGKLVATPLFLALVLVEISDAIFAIDSIPVIFGVTEDPFIVFTSNIFAVLGLRSLFFAVAAGLARFRSLQLGLAGVLAFVGGKMVVSPVFHVPAPAALAITVLILVLSALPAWKRARARARAGSRGDRPSVRPPRASKPSSGPAPSEAR